MGLQILIVDDDEIVVVIHKTLIRKSALSADALPFSNGNEALEHLNSTKNNQDHYLIFLDINMTQMSGWQFLDAVNTKEFKDRVSVVIVTSSINKIDKVKADPYKNVICFLEKPMKKEDCDRIRLMPEIDKHF